MRIGVLLIDYDQHIKCSGGIGRVQCAEVKELEKAAKSDVIAADRHAKSQNHVTKT